jgi:prepilin-type N-terminal cleavage/methylation domain-containing protein
MRQTAKTNRSRGFSLIELMISMMVMMILMGIVSTLFSRSMSTRSRESRRTDALTSAHAALNVMSREISNAGFGIWQDLLTKKGSNGLWLADSNAKRIHFRANVINSDLVTESVGEDITYFFDSNTDSIVRYDPHEPEGSRTSVIINRISDVTFTYYNYVESSSAFTTSTTPTLDTGRVRINVTVKLDPVVGQPDSTVTFTSDVTLRNSHYMLKQY